MVQAAITSHVDYCNSVLNGLSAFTLSSCYLFSFFFFFFFFFLFRATPVAYGSSQVRGSELQLLAYGTATATKGSKPHVQPTLQLVTLAMPHP